MKLDSSASRVPWQTQGRKEAPVLLHARLARFEFGGAREGWFPARDWLASLRTPLSLCRSQIVWMRLTARGSERLHYGTPGLFICALGPQPAIRARVRLNDTSRFSRFSRSAHLCAAEKMRCQRLFYMSGCEQSDDRQVNSCRHSLERDGSHCLDSNCLPSAVSSRSSPAQPGEYPENRLLANSIR